MDYSKIRKELEYVIFNVKSVYMKAIIVFNVLMDNLEI